jgi:hypothetical protein
MKYSYFVFALVFILKAAPVSAFELTNPAPEERRLHIELSPVPSQMQQDFDRYVQDLAEVARKDATPEERARKDDAAKERQPKALNPIALLRW